MDSILLSGDYDAGPCEKEEPPLQLWCAVEGRKLGDFPRLSRLIHSNDPKHVCLAACIIALQARYFHESRVFVTGLHDLVHIPESGHVLKAFNDLYFAGDAARLPWPAARDACLYGACVSATTFMVKDLGVRAPQRALVGHQYVDTGWITQICEAMISRSLLKDEPRGLSLCLSILGTCAHDSRRVRMTLLTSGVLPLLVRRLCRVSSASSSSSSSKQLAPPDFRVQLQVMCVINCCISIIPCVDNPISRSAESISEEITELISPAIDQLVKAGYISYMHKLLTSTDLSHLGPEGAEVVRTLAGEGLLCCLNHSPAKVLTQLRDQGLIAEFPALADQPELMTQRFAVAMLACAVDLLARHQQALGKKKNKQQASSNNLQISASVSRLSSKRLSVPDSLVSGASTKSMEADAAPKAFMSSADFVAILCTSGSLSTLVWMLCHYDEQIQKQARKVLAFLKLHKPTWISESSVSWPEALIEQGCIPVLHYCSSLSANQDEGFHESIVTAQALLRNLQTELLSSDLLVRLINKITSVTSHHRHRSNIAIGLVFLSCGAPGFRHTFVNNGGLASILAMIHNPSSRDSALAFLSAVDSLVVQDPLPPHISRYGMAEEAQEDASLKEAVSLRPSLQAVESGRREQVAEEEQDLVVLVQTIDASRRKSLIEMVCPPAEVLRSASDVISELLDEAEKKEQRLVLEGSYKVWEEIMAHIAQPSTFGRARTQYKPEVLIEMMNITHKYGLPQLKEVYGIALAYFLDQTTAVSIFHAALSVKHGWLAVEAYRVLLQSMDYVCSRSNRALPLTIQLMEQFLRAVLLYSSR